MVSNSQDGEIISRAANAVGVETVRGSQNRGGAKASLELIKRIKEDDVNGVLTKLREQEISLEGYAQVASYCIRRILLNEFISDFVNIPLFFVETTKVSLKDLDGLNKKIDESFVNKALNIEFNMEYPNNYRHNKHEKLVELIKENLKKERK